MYKDIDRIEYISGNEKLLGEIRFLWDKLNEHHIAKSLYFKEHFLHLDFETRIKKLLKKKNDIFVIIAVDSSAGRHVGYCISSEIDNHIGEIDSIYVLPEYRRLGIGDYLIKQSIEWLDRRGVVSKKIDISFGNEEAFEFYKKYKFHPKDTILFQKT